MHTGAQQIPHVDFADPLQCERFIKQSFASVPHRLRHMLVVADRVRQSARDINEQGVGLHIDETLAYCAALVHDIGYLEAVAQTGFHPLDGAAFLRSRGYSRLAELIVGHSCAPEEAALLGLLPIVPSSDIIAKLITYWDCQVKQGGDVLSHTDRLSDIVDRYGENSIVGRANLQTRERVQGIFAEVERLLGRVPS